MFLREQHSVWIFVEQLNSDSWEEIVPMTKLKPGYSESCHNYLSVTYPHRVTHIRLNIYPGNTLSATWIIRCNLKKNDKTENVIIHNKKMAWGEMLQRSNILESHLFCKMNTNEGLQHDNKILTFYLYSTLKLESVFFPHFLCDVLFTYFLSRWFLAQGAYRIRFFQQIIERIVALN